MAAKEKSTQEPIPPENIDNPKRGIVSEDFVFSFGDAKGIIQYNALEKEYLKHSRRVKMDTLTYIDMLQKECKDFTAEDIDVVGKVILEEKLVELDKSMNMLRTTMDMYFNKEKDVCQWKKKTDIKMDILSESLRQELTNVFSSIRKKIKARVEKTRFIKKGIMVDGDGSYIRDEDTELYIYTGAVKEGEHVFVSLENSPDVDEPDYCANESRVSNIIKCGPAGTKFDKPCLLSFPHYALQVESLKFALIVKKDKDDSWKKVESDDKNTSFNVQNDYCNVKTNHFCWYMLIATIIFGKPENDKVLNLGLFGKMLRDKFQLRVRTWSDENTMFVKQEQQKWGEQELQMASPILVTFNDMKIRINPGVGWHAKHSTNLIEAKLLYASCPWKAFYLTIDDETKDDQEATIEVLQGDKIVCSVRIQRIDFKHPALDLTPPGRIKNKKEIFREFLKKISDIYPRVEKYRWLRLLLYDHISISILSREDITAQGLFNYLEDEGNISYNNVTILEEISELTKQTQAIEIVNEYKQNTRCQTDKNTRLNSFRKALFKTLNELTCHDLYKLVDYYKVDKDSFNNIWDLVFFLEIRTKLTPKSIKFFTGNLNEKAQGTFLEYHNVTTGCHVGDKDSDSGTPV